MTLINPAVPSLLISKVVSGELSLIPTLPLWSIVTTESLNVALESSAVLSCKICNFPLAKEVPSSSNTIAVLKNASWVELSLVLK